MTALLGCRRFPNYLPEAKSWKKEQENKKRLAATNRLDSVNQLKPDTTVRFDKGTVSGGRRTANADTSKMSQALGKLANLPTDSLVADSLKKKAVVVVREVKYAPDSLEVPMEYHAQDSMMYDIPNKKVYLWGKAHVKYQKRQLDAAYIEFDMNKKLAYAEYRLDSLGNKVGEPDFDDGENQGFVCNKMTYNFETRRGVVLEAFTSQGDGFLHSEKSKYISSVDSSGTRQDVIYSKNAIYTTCDHPTPHFGVRSTKAKIIPNKMVVVGPSFLEIAGIPTPLALPFGFYPITQTQKSGLILPNNFRPGTDLGFGILGLGWYFALSDNYNLTLSSDVYMRGSFTLRANSTYKKTHRYGGTISLLYNHIQVDEFGLPGYRREDNVQLGFTYNQEPGSHPNNTLRASLNMGLGTAARSSQNDAASVLTNTYNSSASFTRTFTGKPYLLTLGMSHSQSIATKQFDISLPTAAFTVNQFYPFKRKNAVGAARFYEKINMSYATEFTNRLSTFDTLFFSKEVLNQFAQKGQFGIQHKPTINMDFKVAKYFNIRPSIDFTERWYFYQDRKKFWNRDSVIYTKNDKNEVIKTDSIFGKVYTERDYGFHRVWDYGAGVSLTTQVFGTLLFGKGFLRGLRHNLTPTVNFNWRPDFSAAGYGYYSSVQTSTKTPNKVETYSLYALTPYGSPGAGQNMRLDFNLSNQIEAKIRDRKDTLSGGTRKIPILQSFNIGGYYNFLADSMKLSPINISGSTVLFKKINVSGSANFNPYVRNKGQYIGQYEFSKSGRLANLQTVNLTLSTSINGDELKKLFIKGAKATPPTPSKYAPQYRGWSIFESASINYSLNINKQYISDRDTNVITQSLIVNGTFVPSTNWRLVYSFQYDFQTKSLVYPTFQFSRKLHCWDLGFNWQPGRQSWDFFIKVTSGTLSFLNIPMNKPQRY